MKADIGILLAALGLWPWTRIISSAACRIWVHHDDSAAPGSWRIPTHPSIRNRRRLEISIENALGEAVEIHRYRHEYERESDVSTLRVHIGLRNSAGLLEESMARSGMIASRERNCRPDRMTRKNVRRIFYYGFGIDGDSSAHGAAVTLTRRKRFGIVSMRILSRTFKVVPLSTSTVVVADVNCSGSPGLSEPALCTS